MSAAQPGAIIRAGAVPGERIATSERTANSATITTTEAVVDTVTAALVTGRTYGVHVMTTGQSSSAGDEANATLREDNASGTRMDIARVEFVTAGAGYNVHLYAEYTAGATGNKTFVGTWDAIVTAGTIIAPASATQKKYIYVEYLRG